MSFRAWLKRWFSSFVRLLTLGNRRKISERQRLRYRENRKKAKRRNLRVFKRKRTYRRSRGANYKKTLKLLTDFITKTLGIFLVPFSPVRTSAQKQSNRAVAKKTVHSKPNPKPAPVAASTVRQEYAKPKPKASTEAVLQGNMKKYEPPKKAVEVNERGDAPKSKPINEKDQYIRKKLVIRGAHYCDSNVISRLRIGTCFDLAREKDNKYDPNAVVLLLEGEKIGYVAKEDLAPYTIALNLGRSIYGIITNIIKDESGTRFEYETWFRN